MRGRLQAAGLGHLKLPKLRAAVDKDGGDDHAPAGGQFTVSALSLLYFAARLGRVGTKADLQSFLLRVGCFTTDPQPRHLGMQHGLNFLVKGCWHPALRRKLRAGEYCLLDLEHAHPNHHHMHRSAQVRDGQFGTLKKAYDHRCACCGSKEGAPHFKNTHMITSLEKGHCDPHVPLATDNCIPMCTLCNAVYRDKAVFNRRGFIVRWLASGGMVATAGARARLRGRAQTRPPVHITRRPTQQSRRSAEPAAPPSPPEIAVNALRRSPRFVKGDAQPEVPAEPASMAPPPVKSGQPANLAMQLRTLPPGIILPRAPRPSPPAPSTSGRYMLRSVARAALTAGV